VTIKLSSVWNNNQTREANVLKTDTGYAVEMVIDNTIVETRDMGNHNENYAFDCAENFVNCWGEWRGQE